ncbi:MAG: hypothetical protein WC050_04125 [Candidatus Paceibacterota bacterium]
MSKEKLRGLSDIQMALVERVHAEVGELAAASLELVLRKGPAAQRFQGIDLIQLRKICIIADEMAVHLPTKEL